MNEEKAVMQISESLALDQTRLHHDVERVRGTLGGLHVPPSMCTQLALSLSLSLSGPCQFGLFCPLRRPLRKRQLKATLWLHRPQDGIAAVKTAGNLVLGTVGGPIC